MTSTIATRQLVLVAGGGISGMFAALGAAEGDHEGVPVERSASLGGGTSLHRRSFSRMCPPTCGPEISKPGSTAT
jgi:quinone-modifying oxidoreductase subunit QmoA